MVSDHGTRHDRLARAGRSDEHTEVVVDEIGDCGRLLTSEGAPELEVGCWWFGPVVCDLEGAAEGGEQVLDLAGEPAGEVQPFEVFVVGADEPGCVPGGEPHALLLVELRVRDRPQVLQPGDHRGRHARPFDRQLGTEPGPNQRRRRWPTGPREVRRREGRAGVDRSECLGQGFDGVGFHAGDRRQERPLVGPGLHLRGIEEQRGAPRSAAALEGQGMIDPDRLVTAQVRQEHLVGQRQVALRWSTLRPAVHRGR